jgi:adenylate cyclase
MGIEIERKYLVDHDKWRRVKKPAGIHYRQGYLSNENDRTIRIRVSDKQGYITIKGAATGISRKEYEYEIPVEDGIELLDHLALSQVEKVRYCINFAGNVWEIDEFLGDNEGLITAEIELNNEDDRFEQPAWIGREVSDEDKYYNSSLSTHPFKSW